MSATISNSDGTVVIQPQVATLTGNTVPTQTQFHAVIGRSYPDITVRDLGMATGTIEMVFADEGDSLDAFEALRSADFWNYSDSDVESIDLNFVLSGSLSRNLDPQTRSVWLVSLGYQEVITFND